MFSRRLERMQICYRYRAGRVQVRFGGDQEDHNGEICRMLVMLDAKRGM